MSHAPKIKSIVFGFHKCSKQDMISFIDRFRISYLAQHEDKANIGLIERPLILCLLSILHIYSVHALFKGNFHLSLFVRRISTPTLDKDATSRARH